MPSRIALYSDLHLEDAPFLVPELEVDVIVLAGDIGEGGLGDRFAELLSARFEVFYIAGNHDLYGRTIGDVPDRVERHIAGIRFLGTTLWTDIRLNGSSLNLEAMERAASSLSDFREIQCREVPMSPESWIREHADSKAWLDKKLHEHHAGPTVVVTHHAPSPRCLLPEYRYAPQSCFFASDLEKLVINSGASLWCYGHTHHNNSFVLGETRVVSNQRGSKHLPAQGFSKHMVIEL